MWRRQLFLSTQIAIYPRCYSLNELSNDDDLVFTLRKILWLPFSESISNHSFSQEKCLWVKRLPTTKLIDFTLIEKVDYELSNKESSIFFLLNVFRYGNTSLAIPWTLLEKLRKEIKIRTVFMTQIVVSRDKELKMFIINQKVISIFQKSHKFEESVKAKQFNQNSIQISILHNRKSLPNKPKQESWINLVYVHTHTVTARCVLYTERNVMGRCVSWLHTDTRVRSQRISHSKKNTVFHKWMYNRRMFPIGCRVLYTQQMIFKR